MLRDVSDDSVGMLYIFLHGLYFLLWLGRAMYKCTLGQFVEFGKWNYWVACSLFSIYFFEWESLKSMKAVKYSPFSATASIILF